MKQKWLIWGIFYVSALAVGIIAAKYWPASEQKMLEQTQEPEKNLHEKNGGRPSKVVDNRGQEHPVGDLVQLKQPDMPAILSEAVAAFVDLPVQVQNWFPRGEVGVHVTSLKFSNQKTGYKIVRQRNSEDLVDLYTEWISRFKQLTYAMRDSDGDKASIFYETSELLVEVQLKVLSGSTITESMFIQIK